MIKNISVLFICLFIFSCSSLLKYEKTKEVFKTDEFDKKVKIVELEEPKAQAAVPEAEIAPKVNPALKSEPEKKTIKVIKSKKQKIVKTESPSQPLIRQPDIEDSVGFDNQRRPLIDPFKVGEKVTHEVSYLGGKAGTLSLMVKPFAMVNGKKNYNFFIDIKSSSFFSNVYAVDDQVQTYVDYETLVPGAFKLNISDSGQIKEARSFFDFENLKADYWEHRYTEKNGHEEKKYNWTILPYSQNPFSAIFYMRIFKWTVGKDYVFRVADDEKNVIFKGRAIEKTKLSTEAGDFGAIKLKAEVVARGKFSKATDFYIWISDDDRRYILRIEVKLPIGSLVSEVVEIEEGN